MLQPASSLSARRFAIGSIVDGAPDDPSARARGSALQAPTASFVGSPTLPVDGGLTWELAIPSLLE
jgi:hypothetical protein